MEYDLPDLPFDPKSDIPVDEDDRETEYVKIEGYVASAQSAFDSEIKRCKNLEELIKGVDGELLTDDSTVELIQTAIGNIGVLHMYYSRIFRRQRNLCSNSKQAQRRANLTKAIDVAKLRKDDILKTLNLLKHSVFNRKNKLLIEKMQSEYKILPLKV